MLHGSTGRALGSGPRDSWFESRWGSGNAETHNLGAVPSPTWQGGHLGQARAATCADAEARSVERIGRAARLSIWKFAGSSPARTTRGRRTPYAPNLINWGKLVSGSFSIQLLRSRGPQRGVGQLAARLAVNQVSLTLQVRILSPRLRLDPPPRPLSEVDNGSLESACVLADAADLLSRWSEGAGVRISLSPPGRAAVRCLRTL